MSVPSLTSSYGGLTPAGAVASYVRISSSGDMSSLDATDATVAATPDFGGVLQRAIGGVVESGRAAEAQSITAINGGGNLTDVVTAVSQAELALQTTVAIRDRVVQAYQDIMRMSI